MKKILLLFCVLTLCMACKENMIELPCLTCPPLPPPPPTGKNVIVEEFTGVRCVQCPGGSQALEDLGLIHQDKLIVVALHTGNSWSPPLPNSAYDFRTEDGETISNLLGAPDGYPSAVINRNKFDGNTLQKGQDLWTSYINQEVVKMAKVNLILNKSYDSATRALNITLDIEALEDLAGNHNYTILITESGIVDLQDVEGIGIVKDYVHNHVLRDVLTNASGDPLTETLTKDTRIEKSLNYVLPADWVAENCSIVAHLSQAGSDRYILQAEEVKLID